MKIKLFISVGAIFPEPERQQTAQEQQAAEVKGAFTNGVIGKVGSSSYRGKVLAEQRAKKKENWIDPILIADDLFQMN